MTEPEQNGLIDSNILIYAYDNSEGSKHEKAAEFVSKKLLEGKAVFSVQTLSEFSVAVTEKLQERIAPELAKQVLLDISKASPTILRHNAETIIEALNIKQAYKIHFWDALIAATLRENGFTIIFTENEKDFKKIEWLETVNPLK